MTPIVVILFAALGAVYLALWPIRIEFSRRKGIRQGTMAALMPALGGVLLLIFDLTGVKMLLQNWYLLAVFVHFFLFTFGIVFAIKYLKANTREDRESAS